MSAKPVPVKLRKLILERDGYCCTRCGQILNSFFYSLHHRLPRSRGGTHTAANLVTVCGSGTSPGCHSWIERNRLRAYTDGWLLYTAMDPERCPVLRGGVWLQPTAHGWEQVERGLMDGPQGSDHPAA